MGLQEEESARLFGDMLVAATVSRRAVGHVVAMCPRSLNTPRSTTEVKMQTLIVNSDLKHAPAVQQFIFIYFLHGACKRIPQIKKDSSLSFAHQCVEMSEEMIHGTSR